MLKDVVSPEDLKYVPSSFDIVGSREGAIAIVEIPEGGEYLKELIARAIMSRHRNVRTVLAKKSGRKGVYRVREYELVAGDPNTEVVHKEHGIRLKLDVTKVYFSPREATERLRVARQVKPGEVVIVMFAGVGPYALMIAKVQPRVRKVIAIEINPDAYRYMVENVRLNKVEDKVVPVLGDVRDKAPEWYGMCDRVVMPLPKGAYLFLGEAFQCLKPEGGYVHFYHWAHESELYVQAYRHLELHSWLYGMSLKVLGARKVSPYAPRVYKVCLDIELKPR